MFSRLLIVLTVFLGISQSIGAENQSVYLKNKIAQLPGIPWGMAYLGPTELLVSLRAGQLLKLTHLNRIAFNSEGKTVAEERLFTDLGKRIRALVESPSGWIVFSTDDGGIYQVKPKGIQDN